MPRKPKEPITTAILDDLDLEARRLTKEERFAQMVEIAVRFDQHCREASILRDALHRMAVAGKLSPDDEARILLDAHIANENKKLAPRGRRVLLV